MGPESITPPITDSELLELDQLIGSSFYFESQFRLYRALKERLHQAESLGKENLA